MDRVLVFNVKEQDISRDPACGFDGIVSGTAGYLRARFVFSSAWEGFGKIAVFRNDAYVAKERPIILRDNECEIPAEALTWGAFYVSVYGVKGKTIVKTNKVEVETVR